MNHGKFSCISIHVQVFPELLSWTYPCQVIFIYERLMKGVSYSVDVATVFHLNLSKWLFRLAVLSLTIGAAEHLANLLDYSQKD